MNNSTKSLHVAVYSPLLGGFYFGELIGQIRTACLIKGYKLTVIETKGYSKYNSMLATGRVDIVILLRNAVDVKFVRALQAAGKVVISVACDYFPLDVPVVGCDNESGASQAFDYLYKKGHKKITFIGELGQFDVRKRYEAFCESNESAGFEISEQQIISVEDSLTSGGIRAGEQFLSEGNDSSGIIFGACLTAIGFINKLEKLNPERLSTLEMVSFDAFSVLPFSTSDIAIVDQNLHIIAHTAVSLAEQVLAGESVPHLSYVQPKLIRADSDLLKSEQGFMATSMELDEFYDANYMKSVVANMHEWPQTIARSKLDDLMMMEPLFSSYLQIALFSRVVSNDAGETSLKILKVVVADHYSHAKEAIAHTTINIQGVHEAVEQYVGEAFDRMLHIPMIRQERMVAVLSVFGKSQASGKRASFLAMCGYLNIVADSLLNDIRSTDKPDINQREEIAAESSDKKAFIRWDKNELTTRWDDAALSMLGFETELERSIYRHMDITDRVNEKDENAVRALLQDPGHAGGRVYVRLRLKDKSDATFELRHHAQTDGNTSEYALSYWETDV